MKYFLILTITLFSILAQAAPLKPRRPQQPPPPPPPPSFDLSHHGFGHSRDWVFDGSSVVALIVANTLKPDAGSSTDVSGQSLKLEGGRNLGNMEFGPHLDYTRAENGATTSSTEIGGYFRYNFISNTNGVVLVPYVRGDLKSLSVDTGVTTKTGFGIIASGGVTWFPINDTIGLTGYLGYRNYKYSSTPDYTLSGFLAGTAIGLYF